MAGSRAHLLFDLDDKGSLLPLSALGGGGEVRMSSRPIARFRPPAPRYSPTVFEDVDVFEARRQRLTADLPARALDLLPRFQCDRHDDHMARPAALLCPSRSRRRFTMQ